MQIKIKNDFTKNILILMTGTTVAQAIPIAISPILTRVYTPDDFGIFALFMAIASIFGSIANARYDLAIMLPKKDEDAINIFALGFIITSVLSSFLFIIIIVFSDNLKKLLNNTDISFWLYFVPIAVFFTGVFNLLSYFNNRRKNYKDIANATIFKSIVLAIVQLSVGFFKSGAGGLISGQLLSQVFANARLMKNIINDRVLVSRIKVVKIVALAKRYKNFPKFSMWAILANTLSYHLTNILISILYSISTLGFYSLVQRVLGMPSSLVGGSISQVFFQEASKEKQKTGVAIYTFNATIKKLIMIAVPSFSILFFFVEDLFAIVFSEEWRIAGEYAKIVLPFFFIKFIASGISVVLPLFEKQKVEIIWQLLLITITLTVLVVSKFLDLDFKLTIFLLMIVWSVHYSILIFICRQIVNNRLFRRR